MSDFKILYEELVREVEIMRKLQKEYFKHRNSGVLTDAKKAERRVDYLIEVDLFTER